MRKSKRNKVLLSVFLSALLMMSGAFQALASAEDFVKTADPEVVATQEVKEDIALTDAEKAEEAAKMAEEEAAKMAEEEAAKIAEEEAAKVAEEEAAKVAEEEPIPVEKINDGAKSIEKIVPKVLSLVQKHEMLKSLNLFDCDFDPKFDFDCEIDLKLKKCPDLNCDCFKELEISKIWHGGHPKFISSVKMYLYANGKKVGFFFVNKYGREPWKRTLHVPKYHKGEEIDYTVEECEIDGYDSEVVPDEDNNFIIYNIKRVNYKIDVIKNWVGDNLNSRPDTITYQVFKNDTPVGEIKTLTALGGWSDTLELPMYDINGKITYTVKENPIDGYNITYDCEEKEIQSRCCPPGEIEEHQKLCITNTWSGVEEPETIVIRGEKTWLDNGQGRPDKITVKLMQGENLIESVEVMPVEGEWKYIFDPVPKYDDDNKEIDYTVVEDDIQGYEMVSNVDYNLVNRRVGTVIISGEKTWLDNVKGRPKNITVKLMNGETLIQPIKVMPVDGKWTYTFDEVPKYDNEGIEITYTVTEDNVAGYKLVSNDNYNLVNVRVGVLCISGEKFWIDNGQGRPDKITVKLMQGNEVVETKEVKSVKGRWKYTFNEVPKYDNNGKEITYTVTEDNVPGYKMISNYKYNLVNLKVPKTTICGEKTWDDLCNRPDSITVQLLRNGQVISEQIVVAGEDRKWKYEFTDLDMWSNKGTPYKYTIDEVEIPGYDKTITKYNIENYQKRGTLILKKVDEDGKILPGAVFAIYDLKGKHIDTLTTGADGTFKIVLPLGEYTLKETAAPTGYEPLTADLSVTLDENGETVNLEVKNTKIPPVEKKGTIVLKKVNADKVPLAGAVFDILDSTGKVVVKDLTTGSDGIASAVLPLGVYTIKETKAPTGYVLLTDVITVTLETDGQTITKDVINTKTPPIPEKTGTIVLKKVDVNKAPLAGAVFDILNQAGTVVRKDLTTGSDGIASATLPLGVYTIKETAAPTGYILNANPIPVALTTDGQIVNLEVVNTRIPIPDTGTGTIVLKKVDVNKVPLEGAVFDILNQAGTIVSKGLVTGEDGIISVTLPLGVYTIKETAAPTGYKPLENTITVTLDTKGQTVNLEVVNIRIPIPDTGGKIAIRGEKTWDDIMNRPDMITVKLLRNGEEYKELEVKAGENGRWMYEFKDLDESDEEGVKYKYTIEEVSISGYDVQVDGYKLKNYQKRGTLVLNKVNKDKVGLPGAVFAIYDLKGKHIDTLTTGADGTFKIVLPLGMYRVTEVTPPKGYDIKDFSRLVSLYQDGKTMNLEIVNEKTAGGGGTLPNTGGGTSSGGGGGTYTPTLPRTGSTVQPMLYILGLFSLYVGGSELRRKPKRR